MLDMIVRYLHESLVPFRLSSYPSPEHVPRAVERIPKDAVEVETQLVLVADKLTILCFPQDETVDLSALRNELDATVTDATYEDKPEALKRFEGAPPPLGQLYGLPLVVDERVMQSGVIVFSPFGESDYVEIPYDDFARQEQPRIASFARKGELPAPQAGAEPERSAAT
jgi:Ala-tRNA(Pro) deacylase